MSDNLVQFYFTFVLFGSDTWELYVFIYVLTGGFKEVQCLCSSHQFRGLVGRGRSTSLSASDETVLGSWHDSGRLICYLRSPFDDVRCLRLLVVSLLRRRCNFCFQSQPFQNGRLACMTPRTFCSDNDAVKSH